uniref:Uncharacterized protein n=1 Tax=Romanomermis culicivorax TaxID=13658 RepID=A0A915IGX8_ROMCU
MMMGFPGGVKAVPLVDNIGFPRSDIKALSCSVYSLNEQCLVRCLQIQKLPSPFNVVRAVSSSVIINEGPGVKAAVFCPNSEICVVVGTFSSRGVVVTFKDAIVSKVMADVLGLGPPGPMAAIRTEYLVADVIVAGVGSIDVHRTIPGDNNVFGAYENLYEAVLKMNHGSTKIFPQRSNECMYYCYNIYVLTTNKHFSVYLRDLRCIGLGMKINFGVVIPSLYGFYARSDFHGHETNVPFGRRSRCLSGGNRQKCARHHVILEHEPGVTAASDRCAGCLCPVYIFNRIKHISEEG